MKALCACMLLCIVVGTNAVQYVDCGSKGCKINRVDVSGCAADAQTCNFVRGKTVNMTLQFTTNQQIKSLESNLQGNIGGTWVPFSNEQACPHIKPACPISANVMATYTLSLPISELYPTILVPVKAQLTDTNGQDCTCFEVQGKIV